MVTEYDILENWEGPTTENKDWRKKLDKGIREDMTEGMIESPNSEGVEIIDSTAEEPSWYDTLWGDRFYSDDDFYEAMVGWGEPGTGAIGDVGRDLWNQAMLTGDFLTATSPARWLGGGLENSIFHDMMFEGDLYDQIYDKEEYKKVKDAREIGEESKKYFEKMIERGTLSPSEAAELNKYIGTDTFREGDLSLTNTSLLNEIVDSVETALSKSDDELLAESYAERDTFDIDWSKLGKETANYWMTPSNVASDNPYKDLTNKIRIGGNIAPFVVSPITSGARTVGSKVAPAVTKAITNSRFGKTLSNLNPSGIFPSLVNRLPKSMQEAVGQILPKFSGQGTFFPTRAGGTSFKPTTWNPLTWGRGITNRNWMDKNSLRNFGIAGTMVGAEQLFGDNDVQAATISDSWDRDPVVFDDVMTEKIQNFKPTPRGPGPWNDFKG